MKLVIMLILILFLSTFYVIEKSNISGAAEHLDSSREVWFHGWDLYFSIHRWLSCYARSVVSNKGIADFSGASSWGLMVPNYSIFHPSHMADDKKEGKE